MSRITSRYRKHLTIYVNHDDLDKRLKESNRTKSIAGFLRLGLIVLILSILASIGGYIALISNKASIATALQSYASGIVTQLPADMTGSLTLSGGSATLHLNNDKPFVIDLAKDMNKKMDDGHFNNTPAKILIDTSLTTIPNNNEYIIIITQNAFAMQNDNERRVYDFDEIDGEDIDYQEVIPVTQEMIQNAPAQVASLVETQIGTMGGWMMFIVLIMLVIIEVIVLTIYALWYFFLCLIIRGILSIITNIRKKDIPHNKRDLVCILGFGPFIISLFFLSGRLYVLAMIIYLGILITQHHEFHEKK